MAELDPVLAIARPLATRPFSEVSKGYTVFRDRDILAAKITPCWENGKVGQAELDHPVGVGSTEFHVVRPGPDLSDRYLLHFLRQPSVRLNGESRMTGSAGQKRVPAAFLSTLDIPVPPLSEQHRIAAILDHADALRAKHHQAVAHLDTLRSSIFIDTFGNPQEWPKLWPIGSIGDLAEAISYGTSAKAGGLGHWPVLRMGNLTDDGRLDLSDLKYLDLRPHEVEKYTVRPGDMLFNRTNSKEKVGKTAVVRTEQPLAFAGYLVRVRFEDSATAEFVSAYLTSSHGQAIRQRMAKSAVNQANINANEMRHIAIALPPPSIRAKFSECLAAILAERELHERSIGEIDALFASLQSRAFRGEL